jgi:hypothetical protein
MCSEHSPIGPVSIGNLTFQFFNVQFLFTSIYPFTGASQGYGYSHNIIHNIDVEL